ncbi:MAG: methionyl aminopeptidase, partial [Flavobacteriaceae bacterium]
MIHIKNKEEQDILRESGKRLASVLSSVSKKVVPGVSTLELDAYVKELISDMGDTPSFLHYTPEGISYPYPNALCVSVNDEIVHG